MNHIVERGWNQMDRIDREYYESFDWFWKDYDNKKENEQCQKDTNVTNVEKS